MGGPGPAHLDLQKRVPAWLRSRVTGRGMRYGAEIQLAPQYVADVVALCSFQGRFREKYEVPADCSELLMVFECKATRSDFVHTFRHHPSDPPKTHVNRLAPVGSLHWVVAFPGVCHPHRAPVVPQMWGLLERSGTGLREIKRPKYHPITEEQRLKAAHELLWHGDSPRYGERLTSEEWLQRTAEAIEGAQLVDEAQRWRGEP